MVGYLSILAFWARNGTETRSLSIGLKSAGCLVLDGCFEECSLLQQCQDSRLTVHVCRLNPSILGHPLPLPNCFLLSEQRLHMRQSNYFKQIQSHKPGTILAVHTSGSSAWLCFDSLALQIPGMWDPSQKNSSSVFPREGLRAVAFQRDFVVLGPSLQKALVFLTKGLWHPGSTLESSEFGKPELCKKSLQ